jgi:hypothetical protein
METTEHIVEEYARHVLGWFTNSNIKAKNGKEVDIIAIDLEGNKYWIECGITHKSGWALKAEKDNDKDFNVIQRQKGDIKAWRKKNSIDYFVEHKFQSKEIAEKFKEMKFRNYKKIIAVWQVNKKDRENVIEYAKKKGVEIWEMKAKMRELIDSLGETYYSDDILRTLQLANKAMED